MTTPQWRGKHNGLIGDASAMADANDVDQFLGTHALKAIYPGNPVLSPAGAGGAGFAYPLATADLDQPFTMSGTVIGRVDVPLLPVGSGADLMVTLCADASGVPGAVITQTRVPASWIYQRSAVAGASQPSSVLPPLLEVTGNPLATAQSTTFRMGTKVISPYAYPAVSAGGVAASPAAAYYDGGSGTAILYLVGGVNAGTALNNVFSIAGAADGTVAAAVPQPSFPVTTDGSGKSVVVVDADGNATLVLAGGASTFGGTPTADVYTAAIDTQTGNLGAWSQQTSLPVAVQNQAMAASGPYVYCVGGISAPSATPGYDMVYVGQVQNGQITAWNTATAFPTPVSLPSIAVVGGFLMVAGGWTNSGFTTTAATWFAPINADGSLGQWVPGPPLPSATITPDGTALQGNAFGTVLPNVTSDAYAIGFDASGPGIGWTSSANTYGTSNQWYADDGAGSIVLLDVNYLGTVASTPLTVVPTISVPLPATGLTNGGTYHILLQQQGGDLNDYLILWSDLDSFPGNPTALTSPRAGYTWTALTPSGTSIPVAVWDGLPQAPGQKPLHFWEDSGARITTVVRATTPDRRPLGILEATAMPTAQNQNQGFETTLSPWVPNGGTGVRSGARAYEGLWSAQMTPSGSAANVYLESELLPCMPGQSITVSCWVWCTHAVTSNFSMSVNWYTLGNVYIGTSSNEISVPAATWTFVSNVFTATTSGGGAYRYTLAPNLSGTPTASNVYYIDVVLGGPSFVGAQQSSVNQYIYPPDTGYPPVRNPILPSAVVQLA